MGEPPFYSGESRKLSLQPLLQVNDLTVVYRTRDGGQTTALDGATFEVAAGEAVGLLGESGCGKTTLGLALLGLLPPAGVVARGSAFFCGHNLIGLGENELQKVRGAGISMVYQEPGSALNPVLRIGDQITEVIRAHWRFSRERAREEAGLLLAQVGFPLETCIAAAYPHQLSGGQQQRVAIAQAIACRPALLIADEPTTALDRKTQLEILDLLANLRKKNCLALLLISHDFSVLARAVDRMFVVRDGHIVQDGKTQEIAEAPHDAYTRSLLSYSAGAGRSKACGSGLVPTLNDSAIHAAHCEPSQSGEAKQCDRPKPAEAFSNVTPTGSRLDPPITKIDCQEGEQKALLLVSNLQKRYRQGRWLSAKRHQVDALYGIELKVDAGSTVSVVGPSGSGKSTLARCLACLERPDCGEIWFRGVDLAALRGRELAPFRRQIQMIFQDPGSSLNPRLTAVELISEPLLTDRSRTKQDCRDRALDLMAQVGLLPDWEKRLPDEFSAGQRRRLAIARALSVQPTLLILDEALAGLDRPIQTQIADLLLKLQASLSLTYVHISHDLDLVACLADRVVVLHQGQIVDATDTRELLAQPRRLQATSLLSATCELVGLRRELA
jgi:peptide/nickel transport system ATP-binding protein